MISVSIPNTYPYVLLNDFCTYNPLTGDLYYRAELHNGCKENVFVGNFSNHRGMTLEIFPYHDVPTRHRHAISDKLWAKKNYPYDYKYEMPYIFRVSKENGACIEEDYIVTTAQLSDRPARYELHQAAMMMRQFAECRRVQHHRGHSHHRLPELAPIPMEAITPYNCNPNPPVFMQPIVYCQQPVTYAQPARSRPPGIIREQPVCQTRPRTQTQPRPIKELCDAGTQTGVPKGKRCIAEPVKHKGHRAPDTMSLDSAYVHAFERQSGLTRPQQARDKDTVSVLSFRLGK